MTHEPSIDQVFIDKLITIVEKNMGDEKFGVEQLASMMGMSRSQLHRKLRSITDKTVSQFIREQRLKRAMDLLLKDVGTASEIAYSVGFGSPSYFNKCFNSYYGYPPGEVRKKAHESIKYSKSKAHPFISIFTGYGRVFSVVLTVVAAGILIYLYILSTSGDETEKASPDSMTDKSIVVLPFFNMGGDADNLYFVEGITGEIRARLSKVKTLKVISSVSSQRYRQTTKSLPQIADELGVAYVLVGSVQSFGNRARIWVQLIHGESDHYVWSQDYDLEITDVFAVQTEISNKVSTALKTALSPEVKHFTNSYAPQNIEAYMLYLKGCFYLNKQTRESLQTSIEYFSEAIEIEPYYALAYAGLADAYLLNASLEYSPVGPEYERAKSFALKALEIDQNLANAHATLGVIKYMHEWKWEEAAHQFIRAIDLNPNCVTAHLYYGSYLNLMGKRDLGASHVDRALQLDPLSLRIHTAIGWRHFNAGRYDEAIKECQFMHEMDRSFASAYYLAFYVYWAMGDTDKAMQEFYEILSMDKNTKQMAEELLQEYKQKGINGVLKRLLEIWKARQVPPYYYVARTYAFLGQTEKALDWIEKAYKMHDHDLHSIKGDTFLVSIRSEPRYQEILKKMGLD